MPSVPFQRLNWAAMLLTFALMPVWYRLPAIPPLLPPLYISRFLILLPALASIALWLLRGLPGFAALRHNNPRRTWALALLLLALWGFTSTGWAFRRAENPEVGATAALQLGISALFALALACDGPPRRWVAGGLALGVLWNGALAGAQVARQTSVGLWMLGEFPLAVDMPGVSVIVGDSLRLLRPYGLLPHPNMLAGFLAVGLLALVGLALTLRGPIGWGAALVAGLIGLWGLLLTFSRAAWLGMAVGAPSIAVALIIARQRPPWRRLMVAGGAVAAAGLLFAALYSPFLLARAGLGDDTVEQRSVIDRVIFTDLALRAVAEAPLGGVGLGNFPWRSSFYLRDLPFDLRGDNVHNIYLSAWAELGTVGLGLLALALIAGLWAGLRALRRDPDPIRAGLLGGALCLLVVGLFDHYPWTILHFQLMLWGVMALMGRESESAAAVDQ